MLNNTEIQNRRNPVNLRELVDTFDMQSDALSFYVNQKTGEIVFINEDEIDDESDDILSSDDFIEIPSRWDVGQYEIMADFVCLVRDTTIQEILGKAIIGKGAFGRFFHAIKVYRMDVQWNEYLRDRLTEKAIEWCKVNGLAYRK